MSYSAHPAPVDATNFAQEWREVPPLSYHVACWLSRVAPRGKGWFPRLIGRRICSGSRFAVRTSGGALLAVEPSELDYYTRLLAASGQDRRVVNACISLLRPNDVFFDIGAHCGLFAVEVAAAFGGRLRVFGFEPQPNLARAAAVYGLLNQFLHWHIYPLMIGAEPGTGMLFVPRSGYHASAIARVRTAAPLCCAMASLDSLVAAGLPPPNVIKVDVEGAELDVFRGAETLIRRARPALVFEADANLERHGHRRRDLLRVLLEMAPYEFFFLAADGLVPVDGNLDDPSYSDMLAVAPSRVARPPERVPTAGRRRPRPLEPVGLPLVPDGAIR